MRRSIFIGMLLMLATNVQANQDNSLKKESLSPSSDKELLVDSPPDAMIANEAIEALESDREEIALNEVEESDIDIDSLIMEAENALKEELVDDTLTHSGQKKVFLQYDSEENPFVVTEKSRAEQEEAKNQVEVADKAAPPASMEFAEVPVDALSQIPALMQEPFIEISIETPMTMEESPQFSSPEAQIVSPPSYEMNKSVAPSLSLSEEVSSPTPILQHAEEKLATIMEEIPLSVSEISLERQKSITSIPTPQTIVHDKPLQPVFKNAPVKSSIDLQAVFSGSPVIYTLLLCLSIATIALFFYHYLYLRISDIIPSKTLQNLQTKISQQQYLEAKAFCLLQNSFFFKMIASGISVKDQSLPEMVEIMKSEGKKYTIPYWQKLGLLNDIAIVAPMVGLLGTVLGMFYAFYDINKSANTLSSIFDGLGVSVGTTVVGLMVAIMAMIFHSLSKYRLMRILSHAEIQSEQFAHLIKASTLQGSPLEGGNNEPDTR